jgi:hypothetical protein
MGMRLTRWTLRVAALTVGAALAFGLGATPARAACTTDPCAGGGNALFDCDRDGLSDLEECTGLTLAGTLYPRCGTGECVDPRVSDLFVKLERATNSAYTELGISDTAAFAFITQPIADGGLAMRVHVLPSGAVLPSPPPNAITPRQSALVVREVRGTPISIPSQCPVTAALGAINGVVSANGAGVAQVFTQRILDHVGCVYSAAGQSPTGDAARGDQFVMIQHTTAHEATHANRLAPESVDRFGGHHYKAGSGCVMDQASTYTTRGGVRFATPTDYCGPDQVAVAAGETALGRIQCEDPNNVLDLDAFTVGCLPATP